MRGTSKLELGSIYDLRTSKEPESEDFKRLCGVRPDTNNCDGRGSAISLTAWLLYETLRERLPHSPIGSTLFFGWVLASAFPLSS
ncbi:MAG: hypothetical protein V7K92_10890 [Nostoc sp.]|uniref:hypothetical protein n=1 Tax=Nostoc sp. TaxID=1180 RepID=UPI002FEE8EED